MDGIKRSAKMDPILDLLLRDLPEMSGFRICRETGLWSGTVYPILRELERREWIAGEWKPGPEPRARFYRLTPWGRTRALALLGRYEPPQTLPRRD